MFIDASQFLHYYFLIKRAVRRITIALLAGRYTIHCLIPLPRRCIHAHAHATNLWVIWQEAAHNFS